MAAGRDDPKCPWVLLQAPNYNLQNFCRLPPALHYDRGRSRRLLPGEYYGRLNFSRPLTAENYDRFDSRDAFSAATNDRRNFCRPLTVASKKPGTPAGITAVWRRSVLARADHRSQDRRCNLALPSSKSWAKCNSGQGGLSGQVNIGQGSTGRRKIGLESCATGWAGAKGLRTYRVRSRQDQKASAEAHVAVVHYRGSLPGEMLQPTNVLAKASLPDSADGQCTEEPSWRDAASGQCAEEGCLAEWVVRSVNVSCKPAAWPVCCGPITCRSSAAAWLGIWRKPG